MTAMLSGDTGTAESRWGGGDYVYAPYGGRVHARAETQVARGSDTTENCVISVAAKWDAVVAASDSFVSGGADCVYPVPRANDGYLRHRRRLTLSSHLCSHSTWLNSTRSLSARSNVCCVCFPSIVPVCLSYFHRYLTTYPQPSVCPLLVERQLT